MRRTPVIIAFLALSTALGPGLEPAPLCSLGHAAWLAKRRAETPS